MQLVIDIGNTAMKFALYSAERQTARGHSAEDLGAMLAQSAHLVSRCLVSSVSEHSHILDLLKNLNIPCSILDSATRLPIKNLYQSPATLGADRITLATAAYSLWQGSPALVIGAGTCITYNFIDQDGFHGGAISPGITMRFRALHQYTARLPEVDWSDHRYHRFDMLTGTDSQGSILSGVLNGVIQEVGGTIDEYKRRYSGLKVAVTGGDMDFLVKNLKNDIFARPDMVLEGLNYILLHDA